MKLKIKVTQEDINNGEPCETMSCPVALALSRQLNLFNPVYVSYSYFSTDNKYVYLPRSVKRFIHRFDSGEEVKPFNFIINYEN